MPEISPSVKALETALTSKEPIKDLLSLAASLIESKDIDSLHDIDILLADRYIEFLRRGTKDDLTSFLHAILAFVDSNTGDRLQETEEGTQYFHRWEHFRNLCNIAIETYDPEFTARLVSARRHGKELMNLLFRSKDGVRHNELAKRLNMSAPYLSKLLREFEEHDLITRDRRNKISMVKLGFAGRAYMAETSEVSEAAQVAERLEEQEPEGVFAGDSVGCGATTNPYHCGHSWRDAMMGIN